MVLETLIMLSVTEPDFLGKLTVLKSSFAKQKPRVLNCHNYKFCNNTPFRDQVLNKLRNSNVQISDKGLKHFKETCLSVVDNL